MNDLITNVDNTITNSAAKFASTIAQYKWELLPDSQLQAAKQALTKSDYIMQIAVNDPGAVHDALMKSAILGLDLTEGKRQGWLLPRKNQQGKTIIQLQVGYKGVEAIHQRMGVIDRLSIRVVRENDQFEWSGDDQEKPRHEANWFETDEQRGKPKGAFAITYFPDGSINVTVAAISEVYEKHRDLSDSWKSYQAKLKKGERAFPPPWVTHEKAMIEKTMAYIASKQWPANIRNQEAASKILETLHEVDVSDYSQKYTKEQKEAFYKFIDDNDSLGMYLFRRYVDIETYNALFFGLKNTFPKGQKVKMKKEHNEFVGRGENQFIEILRSLDDNDKELFEENYDHNPTTMALLKKNLTAEQVKTMEEFVCQHAA